MSCICYRNLLDLLKSLIPVAQLNLKIPLVVPKIAAITEALTVGQPAAGSSAVSADAYLQWAISLPKLPISLHLATQIAATLQMAETIAATFNVDPYSQASVNQLALTINTMVLNLSLSLPKLALDQLKFIATLNLASTLAAASQFQASFGINLFLPTAAIQIRARLKAILALGTPAPAPVISASVAANAAAYAQLAAALKITGGIMNLLPKLQLLVAIKFPVISAALFNDLAAVNALQQSSMSIQTTLGLNPLAVNAHLAINAALQPLQFLETFELDAGSPAGPSNWDWLTADVRLSASLMAQMKLSLLATLQLPNLAPLSLAAQFVTANDVQRTSSCDPSCPANIRI